MVVDGAMVGLMVAGEGAIVTCEGEVMAIVEAFIVAAV